MKLSFTIIKKMYFSMINLKLYISYPNRKFDGETMFKILLDQKFNVYDEIFAIVK